MGHGHGSAFGNLLAEDWYDRTIGSKDVTKTNSNKLCINILKLFFITMDTRFLNLRVCKELGNLISASRLDHRVKALDDHLTQALGGAHNIGGVDCLVRGDKYKALTAVYHGRISGLIGADGIILYRLTRAVFHKRYMLVCSRMIDNLRAVFVEDLEHSATVADGPDQGLQVEMGVLFAKFKLDLVRIVLIDIEDDELSGIVRGNLAAQLGSDGTAAARDHDNFSVNKVEDFPHIRFDRFAAEKILDGNSLHGRYCDLAQNKLIHAGQVFEFTVCLLTDVQKIPAHSGTRTGNCQINLFYMKFLDSFEDGVAAADNRNAINIALPFVGIVVDDAYNLLSDFRRLVDIAQNHTPCRAAADQHDAAGRDAILRCIVFAQEQYKSVRKAYTDDKNKLQQGAEHIVGDWHPAKQCCNQNSMESTGQYRGYDHSYKLRIAGKTPDAPIQAKSPEDKQADHCIGRSKAKPRSQIVARNFSKMAVKAQPK